MALATDGADLAFDAFKAAGLNPDAPLFFDRAVEVAGKTEHAQFRTIRIPKTNMPVVGFFVCEHLTPQFVYRTEWAKHPNGARGIAGVTVIAEQPARWIPELEKYFGAGSVKRDGEGLVVDTGTQPIRYLTRKDYAARYPGITPVRPGDHPALRQHPCRQPRCLRGAPREERCEYRAARRRPADRAALKSPPTSPWFQVVLIR